MMHGYEVRNSAVARGLGRRAALAGLGAAVLGAAAPPSAAVPASGRLAFQALRDGSPLGTHTLAFTRDGGGLIVAIAVDYVVKFGPIAVFRYTMRSTEHWRDDTLISVDSETNDNGKPDFMRLRRQDGAIWVEGSKSGRYQAPPNALAASHWNARELGATLINPQDGAIMDFKVSALGEDPIRAAGETVPAQRYALRGKDGLDLWYDLAGVWAGLKAVAKDGSVISYVRT